MQAYAGDEPLAESVLGPERAAERAAQWASDAGLHADLASLRTVFSSTGDVTFAESLFFDFVDALGVAAGPATPPAVSEQRRGKKPRPRTARRPSNPLDAFVFDFAAELLKSAGFAKRGRTFRHANARGDLAVVQFRSYSLGNLVDLHLEGGVSPEPFADFAAEFHGRAAVSPDDGDVAWSRSWPPPSEAGAQWRGNTWSVRDMSERAALGQELQQTLSQEVIPTLTALLDRATLLDVVQNSHMLSGHTTMGAQGIGLVLLADEGPSVALDLAMRAASGHAFDQAALAWARRRLADHGHPDDNWRESVWSTQSDPHVRLLAMLESEVDEYLAAAGFTRSGTRYQLISELGDYALVEFTPHLATADSQLRFRLQSAVLPGPELDWRRARAETRPEVAWRPVEPRAATGWLHA
jgi:hypothetical protein